MCGRFALRGSKRDPIDPREADSFSHLRIIYRGQGLLRDRYNIAPASTIGIVRTTDEGNVADDARWWLTPKHVTDAKTWMRAATTFNARSESIARTDSFAGPWREGQRCLIPADALYEWKKEGDPKRPVRRAFAIDRRDHETFAFAGLWEDGPTGLSATIITLKPNSLFAPIHDRMAMILPPSEYEAWLSPDTDPDQAKRLIHEWDPADFEAFEVSSYVNKAGNEGPQCLEPIDAEPRLL